MTYRTDKQIDEMIDRAVNRALKDSYRSSDAWAVVGNFDGRLPPGEVIALGMVFLLFLGMGVAIRFAAIAGGTEPHTASKWLYLFGGLGGIVVSLYIIIELVLALFGREPGEEPVAAAVTTGPVLNVSIREDTGRGLRFLKFTGPQAARVARFAERYRQLSTDPSIDYPLAETEYIGSGASKPWSNSASGEGGRPGWNDFWDEMYRGRLALQDPASKRRQITPSGEAALEHIVEQAKREGLLQ